MTLYGGLNLIVGLGVAALWAIGVSDGPADRAGFWWHVLLWDPVWLAGGLLFVAAVRAYQRHSRSRP
jgi:hypothetical protein